MRTREHETKAFEPHVCRACERQPATDAAFDECTLRQTVKTPFIFNVRTSSNCEMPNVLLAG